MSRGAGVRGRWGQCLHSNTGSAAGCMAKFVCALLGLVPPFQCAAGVSASIPTRALPPGAWRSSRGRSLALMQPSTGRIISTFGMSPSNPTRPARDQQAHRDEGTVPFDIGLASAKCRETGCAFPASSSGAGVSASIPTRALPPQRRWAVPPFQHGLCRRVHGEVRVSGRSRML
jgi:hypothetical protein